MSTNNQPERKKFRVSLEDKVTGKRFSLIVMANSTDEATHSLCGSLIGHDCRYNWRGSSPEYDDEPKKAESHGGITVDREISGFGYEVQSAEGFYIGDICYALNDKVYHEVWGGSDYVDGVYTEPETGKRFAVAGTAHGDGEYNDNKGHLYGVDAGNIGIVPKELCEKSTEGGFYYACPGTAILLADNGVFNVYLPDGEKLEIDTTSYADNEEDEDEDDWKDNCESRSYDCESCRKNGDCNYQGINGRPIWEEEEDGSLHRYDFGFNYNWATNREEKELTTISIPARSEKEARDKLDGLLGGYARARQITIYLNNVDDYD